MSVPLPPSAIDGHCSAVYDDTLYVLSSDSFLSLPLKENATWSTLTQGVPVTGSSCVATTNSPDSSQDALYVLGGTSNDTSFSGVQAYFFANQSWASLSPPTTNMQSRTNHSAVYLPGPASILVYAGSQPDEPSLLSSQTFLISTQPPYNIQSYSSQAPPGNSPLLLPWDDQSAVMIGGSETNYQVWLFGAGGGWSQTQTYMPQALGSQVRGTLIDTADGGKVLETFDMTVSPNLVSALVLQGPGGTTVNTAYPIGSNTTAGAKVKRDLTISNWPTYNSTAAPTTTRSDYGVAQDANGNVVLSGGNSGVPINIFDQTTNTWVDNGLMFAGKANNNQAPLVSSTPTPTPTSTHSTVSASSTSSSSPAASSSAPAVPGHSSKGHMLKILGMTLGVLFGIAALFVLALLLLRWRKQKKARSREMLDEKADQMSFRDRGASFMQEAGGSRVDLNRIPPSHRFTEQNASHNSFAMIASKLKHGSRTGRSPNGRNSSESTRHLVPPSNRGVDGPVELQRIRDGTATDGLYTSGKTGSEDERKRSSGWSRYFEQGESGRPGLPPLVTGALVPPLDFSRGRPNQERISRVATGSPNFNHSAEDLARQVGAGGAVLGQKAHLSNGSSKDSLGTHTRSVSVDSSRTFTESVFSELSSHPNTRSQDNTTPATSTWTPMSNKLVDVTSSPSQNQDDDPRPPSSTYTASIYADRNSARRATGGTSGTGFFGSTRDRDVLRPTSRHNRARSPSQELTFPIPPNSSSSNLLQGASKQESERPITAFPSAVYHVDPTNDDENPLKEAPQPAKYLPSTTNAAPAGTSDMSWFNLGTNNTTTRA